MKEYIGHHTCSMDNGYNYVLHNAPFISSWSNDEDIPKRPNPYLGTGYYFWEFDVQQAKKWGNARYKNGYYGVEAVIQTSDSTFLDLVGDKQNMGHLLLLATRLANAGLINKDFKIGELLEYLKKADVVQPGIFPYKIIRAQDYRNINRSSKLYFRALEGFTYLNPVHIFCIIQPDDVILSNKRIIFQSLF
ncbi:MAG TPA: hypothetical protein VK645_17365 [Chitinophagaceae bacterium]|nr:hypothetical protein [Chitinophagaceae bacterium]